VPNPTHEEFAYLAGIIDGEGSFTLHQHSRKGSSHRFSSQLQIGSTDPRLLEWIRLRFGGSVRLEHRRNSSHKPMFRWIAHADYLADLIYGALPYLIIKREQAELFLAYRATLAPFIDRARSTYKTPQHVKEERFKIHDQLSALNRRGVA